MSKVRTPLSKIDDYPAYLEKCWNEHLQKKPGDAPTVISTFAGCGGSSLGYSMAGFRELLAIEWDDNAVETFKLNFPDVPVYHGDIAKISVEQVLEMTGLQPGELDVFDGSPPCQGFSTAGKRILNDPRNQLFQEFVRLLRGLQPKVFVMENVSGMVKGKMKLIFTEILKELKASGYKVSARLLNAMYFGVPQSRQRLIFIGVRDDLGIKPSHPEAESVPIKAKEAIEGLDNSGIYLFPTKLAVSWWELCPAGDSFSKIHPKGHWFNQQKASPNKPFPTITKSVFVNGGAGVSHWDIPGQLSIEMVKRASGYPNAFRLIGKYTEQWARIGNSVPPLFMRSIAKHIRSEILSHSRKLSEG
jgi:DNA (cytosine-5)-methyltransferase 1